MRILIITSCTGEKKYKPENQLVLNDFTQIGKDLFAQKENDLKGYRAPAGEMYTGQQHIRLMRGLELLRNACSDVTIDLKIVSAGYGLLDEDSPIVPYEATFNGMKAKVLREWADLLKIPESILSTIKGYDLSIFLLGQGYLKAINFPTTIAVKGNLVFLTGKGSQSSLPAGSNVVPIYLGNKEAKTMGAGLVALKGRAIEILGEKVADDPAFLKSVVRSPESLAGFFKDYKKQTKSKQAGQESDALLKADYDSRVIKLPEDWLKSTHRKKIRYFIPEWDDLVNPRYDFENDLHPEGTGDGYDFATYSHQLYESPPYDGILISKIVVEMKKSKKAIFERLGVHRYLRVPREFPIMGDCGAFGYITEEVPPYQTDEILDYYQRLDFDFGVSIDHLIVNGVLKREVCLLLDKKGEIKKISEEQYTKLLESGEATEVKSIKRQLSLFESGPYLCRQEIIDEDERNRRYEITINNARDFIEGHRKGGYRFTPIGAAQGWSPDSYADAVADYQKMGYKYIALGGLVRTTSADIIRVLEAINKILNKGTQLHLFGVARPDAIEEMHRLGVTSVDSASFLRRAWLGASANYHMLQEKYAAIRIPQAEKSPRAKKMVREGKISLEGVKKLEEKCLRLVRSYDRKGCELDEVLEAVMVYDDLMGGEPKRARTTDSENPGRPPMGKMPV
jgi:hypothetical protein